MNDLLDKHHQEINTVCQESGIKSLAVFGSQARGEAKMDSDVDLLVEFTADHKTQDAVIRQLEIIGEATAQLESDFKTDHPEIPWREISDFRNVLAHEY